MTFWYEVLYNNTQISWLDTFGSMGQWASLHPAGLICHPRMTWHLIVKKDMSTLQSLMTFTICYLTNKLYQLHERTQNSS